MDDEQSTSPGPPDTPGSPDTPETPGSEHNPSRFMRAIERFVKVEHHEVAVLLLSALYHFLLLSCHYTLKPLSDERAAASGIDSLKWLFLATLGAMLVASPVFAAIVSRHSRRTFIPWVYRFFALNLFIFFVLMKVLPVESQIDLGRAYYIWTGVFPLFIVSVLWGFMADIFSNVQGKRLFGFVAVGGTLGQIVASHYAWKYEGDLDNLLLIGAVLLEMCCLCVLAVNHLTTRLSWARVDSSSLGPRSSFRKSDVVALAAILLAALPIVLVVTRSINPWSFGAFVLYILGGVCAIWLVMHVVRGVASRRQPRADGTDSMAVGALSGILHVFRSPYLLGICLFMLCYAVTNTFLYVTRQGVVEDMTIFRKERTQFLAQINFYTGVLTILVQIFLTSRLMSRLGVGKTLAVLPVITLVGFAALGFSFLYPAALATTWTLVAFESIRKAGNYGISKPAREVLYTVVSREEKYKSKNFIDTAVRKTGDQVGVWSQTIMETAIGAAAAAFSAVPLAIGWFVVAISLGRAQRKRAISQSDHAGATGQNPHVPPESRDVPSPS